MTDVDFKVRWDEVDSLITGRDKPRNFLAAYVRGLQLTKDFPSEPDAWKIYILAALLNDVPADADKALQQAAQACLEWSEVDAGDCTRDLALYHIRHRNLDQAHTYLDSVFEQHRRDLNRSAVLSMVAGRLSYAAGDLDQALGCFAKARATWQELQRRVNAGEQLEPPNPQWQFNCDRWALKAMVRHYGARQPGARAVWQSLQGRMTDYGSPDLNTRLKLVMYFGRLGNRLDDFIESPEGSLLRRRLGNR